MSLVKLTINSTQCQNQNLFLERSEFPNDLFSLEQRQHGAIIIHILALLYAIILSEHVCDEYFMPSIEYLSFEKLKLSPHVAGATILAASSSMTELFTSIAGVFLAKNDISINILLGSGSYNMLVIIGLSSLYLNKIKNNRLKKYPIFRDCFFYLANLILILFFLFKNNFNKLYWYDSLVGIIIYMLFMIVNIFDDKIVMLFQKSKTNNVQESIEAIELNLSQTCSSNSSLSSGGYQEAYDFIDPYRRFNSYPIGKKTLLCLTFPVRLIGFITILDFRRFKNLKTFISFITLASSGMIIASCAYILIWMVMSVCETFNISNTIVGYVFISAATSMEETITSLSLCKRELKRFRSNQNNYDSTKLNMIISNCIGSNIFDLSIGLGLPYLLNSLSNGNYFSHVFSGNNISFVTIGLLICIFLFLYLIYLSNFSLNLFFGSFVLLTWFIYTILIITIELNKPKC